MVSALLNVNQGLTKGFAVESGEFVQILHTGCGHWHVISTIHPEVNIFESTYCTCSDQSKMQIATATKTPAPQLQYLEVQIQSRESLL